MATAPVPGRARKRRAWELRIGPRTWILRAADIGPGDDQLVRELTGQPLSRYLTGGSVGLDGFGAIQWVVRRKAGEKRLTLQAVYDEFPTLAEIDELIEADEFGLRVIDDPDEDPDVIDVAGKEVLPDPLPSADP